MSVTAVISFCKRFTAKFLEVVGAGIATAVTGYLLAHFSGYWSAPAPAAIEVAPGAGVVSKSRRAQPLQPVSADAKGQRPTPAPDLSPAPMPPAPTAVNAAEAAARQHPTEASAPENRARDEKSVEAKVRAALANVDANRPVAPDLRPQQTDIPPAPAAVGAPSRPVDAVPSAAAVTPPAADTASPLAQQAPVLSEQPLPAVEIKSRPVAAVAASPMPAPPAEEDKGPLALIKKIPDLLRSDSPEADGEAPRPPLPVGK
jgi:hypothetical protein